jgi:hypothetical protein
MPRDAAGRLRSDVEPISDRSAPDSGPDLIDVPAAVVCAVCRDPECPGCAYDEPSNASGVVAVVPWERPGLSLRARLWGTARLATGSCDSFFAAMPDGDVASALRFAVAAELLAVLGLVIASLPLLLFFAPRLLGVIWADPLLHEPLLRSLVFGIPGLSLAMVAVHGAHGIGLDLGARRHGSTARRGRGLRFGLYACGWDLVTLPLGLIAVAVTEGLLTALKTLPLSVTVPNRAARAYLRGIHGLADAEAAAAARFGAAVAAIIVAIGTAAVIVGAMIAAR